MLTCLNGIILKSSIFSLQGTRLQRALACTKAHCTTKLLEQPSKIAQCICLSDIKSVVADYLDIWRCLEMAQYDKNQLSSNAVVKQFRLTIITLSPMVV